MYNKSIFILCLLDCFVCVCVWVQKWGCMCLLVCINGLFGFISLWQITRYTCIPSYSSAEYPFTPIFLLALCHHIDTFTVRGEHSRTFLLSLCPSGSCVHISLFFPYTLAEHTIAHWCFFLLSLCYYTLTYIYTHRRPVPSLGPRATQNDMRLGSCSLISSSHTHSGSAITSGGPVRHECYPVDNNHSGGRRRDPIPYLLTAPHPPPGAQVALKK